ncbi:hypothetical protein [Sphingobacterium bovistauri]|uniref:Uncharacterized protein n=1 Tax=Sphingobacterium bovistauri TaxID=2781959 RepID=A0ABS7Z9X0_9SPHI|nr:hypothetical protein [Sphingobacterium bovistauri]MCA5005724.1 hypothetical protein [Sphingobacterium bovistauri]
MKQIILLLKRPEYLLELSVFIPILFVVFIAGSVDSGPFFVPIFYGLYLSFLYKDRLRNQFLFFVVPIVFFVIFITIGGLLLISKFIDSSVSIKNENVFLVSLLTCLVGGWCSWLILFTLKLLFRVRLKIIYFIISAILVAPPYLMDLSPTQEATSGYFYLIWNAGMSVVVCLMFFDKNVYSKSRKI